MISEPTYRLLTHVWRKFKFIYGFLVFSLATAITLAMPDTDCYYVPCKYSASV